MKKFLYVTIFLGIAAALTAQSERRIFLWDVTLSMKGFNSETQSYDGKVPDIYDKVKDGLCKTINSIVDENTEVIILPFQDKILNSIKGPIRANSEGKKELAEFVKKINNKDTTLTNISEPVTEVMTKYTVANKRNLVFLFTDGVQSSKFNQIKSVSQVLREWNFKMGNDDYFFYVMLTEEATKQDISTDYPKQGGGNIEIITKPEDINFVELMPQNSVTYKLKDEFGSPILLQFSSNANIPVETKIRVKLSSPNPYFDINQELEINNKIVLIIPVFYVEYQTYELLKNALPEKSIFPVLLEVINNDGGKILLLKNNFDLEIINKRVKTLKISVNL